MRSLASVCLVILVSIVAHGCAFPLPHPKRKPPPPEDPSSTAAIVESLKRYDTDGNGTITLSEVDAVLRADFAKADVNHDGALNHEEVSAENEQRWERDHSTTAPLYDWAGDGFVDFTEFASIVHSLFEQIDSNNDGSITPEEMRPMMKAVPLKPERPHDGKRPPQRPPPQ